MTLRPASAPWAARSRMRYWLVPAILVPVGLGFTGPAPTGVVRGRVLSGVDSSALSSAMVTLEGAGTRQDRFTDEVGTFLISAISPGAYSLTIRALGYPPLRDTIRVNDVDTLSLTIALPADCQFDSIAAVRDIARRRPKILLHGGIAPIAQTPTDQLMERKYGFRYREFGDELTEPMACDDQYNRVVFRFLDSKFGNAWRDSVRTR